MKRRAQRRLGAMGADRACILRWVVAAALGCTASGCVGPGLDPPGASGRTSAAPMGVVGPDAGAVSVGSAGHAADTSKGGASGAANPATTAGSGGATGAAVGGAGGRGITIDAGVPPDSGLEADGGALD